MNSVAAHGRLRKKRRRRRRRTKGREGVVMCKQRRERSLLSFLKRPPWWDPQN